MIWIVILIVLFLVTAAVVGFLIWRWRWSFDNAGPFAILIGLAALLVWPTICYVGCRLTTGFGANYSDGVREGFVTKVSVKGYIWKTTEAQIQVGTGDMAALQSPFAFSIVDPETTNVANAMLGKRVRVTYHEWLIQPWHRGESGYEAVKIEAVEP